MHKRTTYLSFLVFFLLILGVFSFTDLSISIKLLNMDSTYGLVFAAVGEMPAFLIGAFSSAALLRTRTKEGKGKNIGGMIGYGGMLLLFSLGAASIPTQYINMPWVIVPLLTAIYVAVALWLSSLGARSNPIEMRKASVVAVLLVWSSMLVVNVLKIFWGRMRMRIMDDPINQFTPWFLPQGIVTDDDYKSFPSGHAANAAVSIWITMLPLFVKKLEGKQVLLGVIASAWTVLVMISRIILGSHFASDVWMGSAITVFLFFLLHKLVGNYYKRKTDVNGNR